MATYTPNLNLKKPSTGELYDVVADNNDAKDKIDAAFGNFNKNKTTIAELIQKHGSEAWAQALNYKTLIINQNVSKTGTYGIPAGQHIIFENNAILTQNDNLSAFETAGSYWDISGAGTIQKSGVKPTIKIAGSIGILVKPDSFDWSITGNIKIEHFAETGLRLDGGGIITGRVAYTQISGVTCFENWDGYHFIDGFPAEYVSFSNCQSISNTNDGVYEETGNINWNGGAILFNGGGVHLKHPLIGGNPHHGMFTGTHINHNGAFQLWAEKVAFGYDFNGCHFYDNDNETIGRIKLDNCRGINITDGTIGCHVEYINDTHVHVGYNRIAGNKIDRDRAIITGVGFDRTKLIVEDNFDIKGTWKYNDVAKVYAQKYLGTDQIMTSAISYGLMGLGNELSDNRNCLGTSFITPFVANYIVNLVAKLECSQAFTTEYITFERDDDATGSFLELYRLNLADIKSTTGLSANINFLYEFVVSGGGQFIVYLKGCIYDATYTFKPGTLLTIKTNN